MGISKVYADAFAASRFAAIAEPGVEGAFEYDVDVAEWDISKGWVEFEGPGSYESIASEVQVDTQASK